jgi:hypothetical protein
MNMRASTERCEPKNSTGSTLLCIKSTIFIRFDHGIILYAERTAEGEEQNDTAVFISDGEDAECNERNCQNGMLGENSNIRPCRQKYNMLLSILKTRHRKIDMVDPKNSER